MAQKLSAALSLVALLCAASSAAPSRGPLSRLTVAQAQRVAALVENMTLAEKIGQMTQPDRRYCSPSSAAEAFLGSVLSGGGSVPGRGTPEEFADMYDEYQRALLGTRLSVPLIYGQDAVHGVNNMRGSTLFPHNIGLGATRDAALLRAIGAAVGRELLATGSTWTFAPCVAVARDDRWGRTYESFGETPELAAELGAAYVAGVQESGLVQGCAKHYLGDGGTQYGTGSLGYLIDEGNTVCDEATLRKVHMPGYVATAKDVATVMVSFSSWNGLKMSENKYLITDVLKGELGFDGLVVSDWDAVKQVSGSTFREQVVHTVNAGMDMFMVPVDWRTFIADLTAAVQAGEVSMERIDDAVTRILSVKARFGLFDHPYSNRSALANWGNNRDLARSAVQKTLVLLQNNNDALPIKKTAKVFVAGSHADDLGYQCGGWTISWQGGSGAVTDGTTIRQGIEETVRAAGGSVDYNKQGKGAAGHQVAIVVVGETPYAEGHGDVSSLEFSNKDWTVVDTVHKAGVPIVLVVVAGRPRILPPDVLSKVDSVVMAWLPGTEGQGVADVLFGDASFTGKLPVSWPRETSQEPINDGDASYDPLFPYGFGL